MSMFAFDSICLTFCDICTGCCPLQKELWVIISAYIYIYKPIWSSLEIAVMIYRNRVYHGMTATFDSIGIFLHDQAINSWMHVNLSELHRKGCVMDWEAVAGFNMVRWWKLQWTRGMPKITALKMDTAPTSPAWYTISHVPVLCLIVAVFFLLGFHMHIKQVRSFLTYSSQLGKMWLLYMSRNFFRNLVSNYDLFIWLGLRLSLLFTGLWWTCILLLSDVLVFMKHEECRG